MVWKHPFYSIWYSHPRRLRQQSALPDFYLYHFLSILFIFIPVSSSPLQDSFCCSVQSSCFSTWCLWWSASLWSLDSVLTQEDHAIISFLSSLSFINRCYCKQHCPHFPGASLSLPKMHLLEPFIIIPLCQGCDPSGTRPAFRSFFSVWSSLWGTHPERSCIQLLQRLPYTILCISYSATQTALVWCQDIAPPPLHLFIKCNINIILFWIMSTSFWTPGLGSMLKILYSNKLSNIELTAIMQNGYTRTSL